MCSLCQWLNLEVWSQRSWQWPLLAGRPVLWLAGLFASMLAFRALAGRIGATFDRNQPDAEICVGDGRRVGSVQGKSLPKWLGAYRSIACSAVFEQRSILVGVVLGRRVACCQRQWSLSNKVCKGVGFGRYFPEVSSSENPSHNPRTRFAHSRLTRAN